MQKAIEINDYDELVDRISRDITDYPDTKRIQWLKSQQWYTEEHDKLNIKLTNLIPKTQIVAHSNQHIPIEFILTHGQIIDLPVIDYSMENSRCHDNCDKLYLQNDIVNVYSGFALSDDGLWRTHSWGYDTDDEHNSTISEFIVETTEPRLLYFGVKIYQDKNK